MKIDVAVFDWSGVISDDRRPVYEANMKILRKYGKPTMSFEAWLPKTTLTPVEFLADHEVYGDPNELFNLYKEFYDEAVKSGIAPKIYPDVHSTFQYLKDVGKEIAILSSHPTENLIKEIEQYDLTQFLDLIVGNSKDKVAGLKDICEKLGVCPASAILIGDTIYDIRAAKKLGAYSGAVCNGYHTRERLQRENPDLLMDGISELKNYIK